MFSIIDLRRIYPLILTLPAWGAALLLAAKRPDGVGQDTANYRSYFNSGSVNLDIGFDFLLRGIASLTDHSEIFFGVIFILVTFFMLKAMMLAANEIPDRHKIFLPVLCTGLLMTSSWFNVATLNGLRQGISLSILLFAIHIIYDGRRFLGGGLIVLALSFHYSTLFAVASLVILLLSTRLVFALFYVSAVLYASGVYERLVSIFSALTGVGLYDAVKNYANGVDLWRGFQLDLFVYTIFWPTLYLAVSFLVRADYRKYVIRSISVYCALCLPYFILGYGSFSNRFGLMAWIYLPVLHAVFLVSARLTASTAMACSFFFFVVGLTKYIGFFFGSSHL